MNAKRLKKKCNNSSYNRDSNRRICTTLFLITSIRGVIDRRGYKMAFREEEAEIAVGACSYELKCPICLEEYDNKFFVNVCFRILLTK